MASKKPKPFRLSISGQTVELTPDNCGVALFRTQPDYDYLDTWEWNINDEQEHTIAFNPLVAHWIGGLALRQDDHRELRVAERENGTFRSKTNFNPQVIIEDEPSEAEKELYAKYLIGHALDDDEHLHQDLNAALADDLSGEGGIPHD